MRPVRHNGIKGSISRARIPKHSRRLPEIIQDKRGEHEEQPGCANGALAEMTHIGIERLSSGDGEKHYAKCKETLFRCPCDQRNPIPGIEPDQDGRAPDNRDTSKRAKYTKPDHHNRTEQGAYACSPARLKQE